MFKLLLALVVGPVLFWRLIGGPLVRWLGSVRGIRFVRRRDQ